MRIGCLLPSGSTAVTEVASGRSALIATLSARHGVRAEHGVRVMVLTRDKSLDLAEGDRFVFR